MTARPQGARTPSRASRALQVALIVGLLGLIGWQIARDLPSLRGLSSPRAGDLLIAAACSAGALSCFALSSVAMVAALDLYRREHRFFYFRIWMQAYVFRYFPGKIVLVYQRVLLGRRAGIPGPTSVVLVGWETILQMLAAALVTTACLGGSVAGQSDAALWIATSAAIAIAMLFAFPLALTIAARWPRLQGRLGDLARLRLSRRAQLGLALSYAVAWLGLASSFFFVCRAFVPLGAESYARVVFWFVASYVAGVAATVAPAGLGVREGLLVFGLSAMLPPAQAAALAIAGRLWMTFVELACTGAACLIPAPPTAGPNDDTGSTDAR